MQEDYAVTQKRMDGRGPHLSVGKIWNGLRFLAWLIAVAVSPVAAHATDKPNIIIIMADDLGWNDVGYHGSEIKTPHIDRLAETGRELTRFYVNSVCSPTRASLMTGQSAIRLGITSPMPKITPKGLPLALNTLPDYLRQLDYQTALVGKWHLGVKKPYHPNQRGFDSFYGNLSGAVGYWDHVHGGHYDWQRNGKTFREDGYVTHLQAAEAVRVLRTRDKARPLFLFLSLGAPHLPNEAPQQAINAYAHIDDERRRVHAAMVSELDTAVGDVMAALDAEGVADNTLVWFMSDNGGLTDYRGMPQAFYRILDTAKWIWGDDIPVRFIEFMRSNTEDGGSDNSPLTGAKGSVREGGIRVPGIVRWPEKMPRGKFDTRLSVLDILPTLLDAAKGPLLPVEPHDGRSFLSALRGQETIMPAPFITEAFNGTQAIFHAQWKLLQHNDGSKSLFDIHADPGEKRDVAMQHPDIVARLAQRLNAMPKGENLAVPLWKVAIDPDEFGGVERKPPLAELYD
jgi:arylsulfatase A-like enzyme